MPEDRAHHISKKRLYDILWVPIENSGQAKSVRVTPLQVVGAVSGSILVVVVIVLVLLMFTPLGTMVPIPNPELENRYNRELLSINQRMSDVMQQLVELRTYNVKLRQALGEDVVLTDSGIVSKSPARTQEQRKAPERQQSVAQAMPHEFSSAVQQSLTKTIAQESPHGVVFPAIMPAEGFPTRGFEPDQRHYGLDIAGKSGSPVKAAADGYVIFAGWTNEYGNVTILSHAGGFLTFYKHNQTLLKPANSFVKRGEPIALMGNSGITSSGTHLHFEIWKDGAPVNPALYLVNLNF